MKKTYHVYISEVWVRTVSVEAENADEAINKVVEANEIGEIDTSEHGGDYECHEESFDYAHTLHLRAKDIG